MTTPIWDFVQHYRDQRPARFHMPGHKGEGFLGVEWADITEVPGADDLYHADGIILASEDEATRLYGTRHTFYSAGGSSQAIKAMLHLAQMAHTGTRPVLLAARNAHKALLHGCALLGIDCRWLYPEETSSICSCPITPDQLDVTLSRLDEPPLGVYVTSPDFLGGMADIAGLAQVCQRHSVPLLVDNAHGAYLKFLSPSLHPMDLGATLCCDSAHKTLPVLTGGSYLHVSRHAPVGMEAAARDSLALFGSSSPSYLILQSLDRCNPLLGEEFPRRLAEMTTALGQLKARLSARGIVCLEGEPLKLVLDCHAMGHSAQDVAPLFARVDAVWEYLDDRHLVFMVSPWNTFEDLARLEQALDGFQPAPALDTPSLSLPRGQQACTPRQAMLAKSEEVPLARAVGRICAQPAVSCPPAIPIAVSGEVITEEIAALFAQYGIHKVWVVWEKNV